jgi:hypothetical protein
VVVGAGRNPRTIAVYDIKVLAADGIKNIHAHHTRVCTKMTNVVCYTDLLNFAKSGCASESEGGF